MVDTRPRNRSKQAVAWLFTILFAAGFFVHAIGSWTGPILGAWFVGTQRLRRSFLWMLALAFLPTLIFHGGILPHENLFLLLRSLVWLTLAATLSVLPFAIHRYAGPRLPGFVSTLPLPFAAVIISVLAKTTLPSGIGALFFDAPSRFGALTALHLFLIFWLGSTLVWAWNHEFRAERIAKGGILFAILFGAGQCFLTLRPAWPALDAHHEILLWPWIGATVLLVLWPLLWKGAAIKSWRERAEAIALLRSPLTGASLRLAEEGGDEIMVSEANERFPIRNGIPAFVNPEEITGANRKYNMLYETIAGFYDDTQRVGSALIGMDRDAYVRSYLNRLEVRPDDRVLETSVGTGLNFKYLPRSAHFSGLDLSTEMLARCQDNLRRWRMDADLYLGNAEFLPFTDNSFDVVFHVGGINFFSDRERAIREMIRVAKPDSLLLIADETEEHVRKAYEKMPYTQEFYKNRNAVVSAPVDLLPPGMEEIHVETVWGNRFYALTFRKPRAFTTELASHAESVQQVQ